MNLENAYSKGGEVKYLLKNKTSGDLVEFNSQSPCLSSKGTTPSVPPLCQVNQ